MASAAASSTKAALRAATNPKDWTLAQTMLRIKDPSVALPFFTEQLGFRLLQQRDFEEAKFSLYFLATVPKDVVTPKPGTAEAKEWLASWDGCVLELTHNHGTETQEGPVYHNGNSDPRGFGHIGVIVDDVYATCDALEAAGVAFQKKPDEGKMKGLAFAKTPGDEYWVEILKRTPGSAPAGGQPVSFQQSMLRVKDPAVSVPFYETHFGMTLVCRRDFPDMGFSLYFMASLPAGTELPEPTSQEAWEWCLGYNGVTLELTHNHGTETQEGSIYHNGNSDPRGFGHIAFMCDNLLDACEELDAAGVKFHKKPWEGRMKSLAFALDPDGYWIEVIQRAESAHKGVRPKPE